jgi:hypothetical protein
MGNLTELSEGLRKHVEEISRPLELARMVAASIPSTVPSASIVPRIDVNFEKAMRAIVPLPQQKSESVRDVISGHIKALQAALADDEQLLIFFDSNGERITVYRVTFPSWHTVCLFGVDGGGNRTSIISSIDAVQLIHKVIKIEAPQKPVRIGFLQV